MFFVMLPSHIQSDPPDPNIHLKAAHSGQVNITN